MMNTRTRSLLCGLLLFVTGCDGAIDSVYEERLVLSAYLFAGEPIDSVVLERTTEFGKAVVDSAIAISGADIIITVQGEELQLTPIPGRPGRYHLPSHVVRAGEVYSIVVRNEGHELTSTTRVPMPIRFIDLDRSLPADRILVLDTDRIGDFKYSVEAGPKDQPFRSYMLQVTSLDTLEENRIRAFAPGPPIDTNSYARYSFLRLSPKIPIDAQLVAYYGRQRITIYAVDSNWYDYHRMVFGQSGTYQPSLNHVNGGLGVFAAAARDTLSVLIKPPTK